MNETPNSWKFGAEASRETKLSTSLEAPRMAVEPEVAARRRFTAAGKLPVLRDEIEGAEVPAQFALREPECSSVG